MIDWFSDHWFSSIVQVLPVRVKFHQATWPWNSDIEIDFIKWRQRTQNGLKYQQWRTWPTPQKVKWLYLKFRQGTFVPPLSLRGSLLLGSVWLIGQPGPICLNSWLVLSTNKVHNCDQLVANVTYKVLILQGEVWC